MSDPFCQRHLLFFQHALQFRPQIIDIVRMLACFIPQIHRVIREQDAESERYRKCYAGKSFMQSHQHRHTARQSAVKGRESARGKDVSEIKTLVSDDVDNHFENLYDDTHDDDDENGIHMESCMKKILERLYSIRDHGDFLPYKAYCNQCRENGKEFKRNDFYKWILKSKLLFSLREFISFFVA